MKKRNRLRTKTNRETGITGLRATVTAASIVNRLASNSFVSFREKYNEAGLRAPSAKVIIDWLIYLAYVEKEIDISQTEYDKNEYIRVFGKEENMYEC
jgi:hypothetical protein